MFGIVWKIFIEVNSTKIRKINTNNNMHDVFMNNRNIDA